jgi:hypothetical protein
LLTDGSAGIECWPSRALDRIITLCAQLPLALSIVAARAAAHPQFRLEALAQGLHDIRNQFDALDGGDLDTNVRWRSRGPVGNSATRPRSMFRLLGLHPGPDISIPPPRA